MHVDARGVYDDCDAVCDILYLLLWYQSTLARQWRLLDRLSSRMVIYGVIQGREKSTMALEVGCRSMERDSQKGHPVVYI